MLTFPGRSSRPAAWCRRPAFLLLVVVLAVTGCSREESLDPPAVRRAAERAIAAVRESAPEQAREIERLIEAADAASARMASRRWSPARRQAEAAAWCRVAVAASRSVRQVRAEEERELLLTEVSLEDAGRQLDAARRSLQRPGMGHVEASALAQAEAQMALARRLADARRWAEARSAAERAVELAGVPIESFRSREARFHDPDRLQAWRHLADLTVRESRLRHETAIVVDKYHRRLVVYRNGRPIAAYTVELGANGLERKAYAGDRATPEGRYRIVTKKHGGATKYHKALLLDYPNAEDRERYRALSRAGEVPPGAGIGSLIEIHGEGGSGRDWTDGCIALTNQEMDELYKLVTVSTKVTIVGRL